jgi:Ca-activated chloride channel homolog
LEWKKGLMTEMTSPTQCMEGEATAQQTTLIKTQLRNLLRKVSKLRWPIALVFGILVPMIGGSQARQPSPSGTSSYTLKMNGDMVILNATVLDPYDTIVAGLNEDDFQVYEDGVLQQIQHFSHEDLPVTVGILVDNSGSMGSKHADTIAAAVAFARSSNPHDQMFVVNFSEHASLGLPANMPFTDRRDQLQLALSEISAIGHTALYDGVAVGLDHLKQGDHEKKVLILISDGGDNASQHTFTELIDLARQSGVIIYAIGIFDERDGDRNPGLLRRLATETGGEAFFPQSSVDIAPICEAVARRIRSQYTLAYIPTNAKRNESIAL